MNQRQFDRSVQLVIALAALALLAFFVWDGGLSATEAVPVVLTVLGAFEIGRRQEYERQR
jgi:uncharacterized membrane protein (UPF0136 family)